MNQAFNKLHPCQYAIIRFLPFAETGEFANVGVVLACPSRQYFDFRLLSSRKTRRIRGFFEQIDLSVYREAISYFREDLERLRDKAATLHDGDALSRLFASLVYPRDTLLRFGETRAVLADDPRLELERLFARQVGRDFVDTDYQRGLEHRVREVLMAASLKDQFVEHRIGDDYVHSTLPFVHVQDAQAKAAIKPLNLARTEANQVLETGGSWITRVRLLRKHALLPEQLLFAVQHPDPGDAVPSRAANEIAEELQGQGVHVVRVEDTVGIVKFAREATAGCLFH